MGDTTREMNLFPILFLNDINTEMTISTEHCHNKEVTFSIVFF